MARPIKTIAVVGAGSIGMYYGGRLARTGLEVRFLMRSDRDHVLAHGLKVTDPQESFVVAPVAVYGDTTAIGQVDLVIIALKATTNGVLPGILPPLLGPETIVLTLQNGLGVEAAVAETAGSERTLGGICFVCINRTGPGAVTCTYPGMVKIGEFGRPVRERTRAIAEHFRRAGVVCEASDNLEELRWRKLLWNVPFNGLAIAAGGVTTDRILADERLRRRARLLMEELARAGARLGYAIAPEFIELQFTRTGQMGAYRPSSLVDYLAGREVEVDAIWGEPLRRARKLGEPMPELEALHAELERRCANIRR